MNDASQQISGLPREDSLFTLRREESLRAQAVRQIRDSIVTGMLVERSMHSEQKIASQLGISRTPVREALLQLAHERLIEFVPHRGVRIAALDPEHLVQVLEYRAALESYCAAALASHPRNDIMAALDEQLELQNRIVLSNDRLRWVGANIDFHRILIDSLGNKLISDAFPTLAAHTMRIGFRMNSRKERMQESIDEHAAMLEAMRQQRPDEARRLAADHLRITKLLMKQLFDDYGLKRDTREQGEDRERA